MPEQPSTVVSIDTGTTIVNVMETAETPPRPLFVTEERQILLTSEQGPQGAPGPPGPPGRDGEDDKHYEHVQDTAATRWVCVHPLGKRPSVAIIDSAGSTLDGDVTYPAADTVVVEFVAATSGRLILN